MVRLKSRYLLVHILYPSEPASAQAPPVSAPSSSTSKSTAAAAPSANAPPLIHFHRPTPDTLNAPTLIHFLRDTIATLFGDYGAGLVSGSLSIKYLSPATSTFILRVARAHFRVVWAALTTVTCLPRPLERVPCVLRVVHVAGSMRLCEVEAVRRAREAIERAKGMGDAGLEAMLGGGSDGDVVADGEGDEDEEEEGSESEMDD